MKYQVLENNIPCDARHHKGIHHSWNNSTFNTLQEAIEYAKLWFDDYWPYGNNDILVPVNKPVEYYSFKDNISLTFEIREIQ